MGHPKITYRFLISLSPRRELFMRRWLSGLVMCLMSVAWAQGAREKVIIDTDIGDDVDDAFAIALAVKSPELEILGVTTTFGETEVRAQLVDRFLREIGRAEIPVMAGKPTAATPM